MIVETMQFHSKNPHLTVCFTAATQPDSKLSAKARAKIAVAQRARWAKVRAKQKSQS